MTFMRKQSVIVIPYQFVQPHSVFRWEKISWYKKSWSSKSSGVIAEVEMSFDENCLVATSKENVSNDYISWAVDTLYASERKKSK